MFSLGSWPHRGGSGGAWSPHFFSSWVLSGFWPALRAAPRGPCPPGSQRGLGGSGAAWGDETAWDQGVDWEKGWGSSTLQGQKWGGGEKVGRLARPEADCGAEGEAAGLGVEGQQEGPSERGRHPCWEPWGWTGALTSETGWADPRG